TGAHTLRLKVWDVANNSTEVKIDFVVTGDFTIETVQNIPNPVSRYTDFTFSHNQTDATLLTQIEIFNLAGQRIDLLKQQVSSSGNTSSPVKWVMAERGIQLRNGVYPYRITIRSADGKLASKSGKMLIAR
ncbi:MAG TPA: T9SS type A sorting domain-containing protein, partial [Prolixibacteraceae bacterium]|nr:T9SS type A sorting domain-containing protein [Prolixibacteraceae bacterium]